MEIVEFPSANHGPRRGVMAPDMIVIHYTGMASAALALARLANPSSEVSAHYLIDETGRARLDSSVERLIKVVAIASGLGSCSAYTWLKLPASDRMAEVAGATTMPIVMLGGDPGADAAKTFAGWQAAMAEPNVRGLVAGRALVYPEDGDVEKAVTAAAQIVHPSEGK